MKVGLYIHKLDDVTELAAKHLYEGLREKGVDVKLNEGCLCQTSSFDKTIEMVICHPDNKAGCWSSINRTVKENPHTKFYIYALQSDGRKEAIGQHPNLEYIEFGNIGKIMSQFYQK